MARPANAANDPERGARILDAALDVIAERGVQGASHRAIATQAGVPLGSLTYHFGGITDILEQAFARLADSIESVHRSGVAAATDREAACHAVADFVMDPVVSGRKRFVLMMQMYAYATQNERVAQVLRDWQRQVYVTLENHFSPDSARAIASVVEGCVMHRHFDAEDQALTRVSVLTAVEALSRP
ncbi:TetR/AcrR family transcriptional regulator [Citricoccus alkalitolerans]|uniref:TetR/AcrR family transcriptional regulator n=1 Tax=Citricoccus alkalitolerans TaxID=246603 RepID=A0ABV8XU89_9MICC